jgi:transposase InsO family protein
MPKPAWVRREIIRIKAHAHESGCRAVADIFNRHFAAEKGITVGKSYVACILRTHSAEIINLRHKWKHRIPKPVPQNLVWAMDLTGITDSAQKTRNILGIIDHGTRKCLCLKALGDKASITLLKILIQAIDAYGKPKVIRTDNEAVFTSRLFNFGLWLLGIRHQRTMLHCPWQNGRIERFFGTFKSVADRVLFEAQNFQFSLNEFSFWYNHIRPHRHLNGRTPDEAWSGVDPYLYSPKSCRKFSAWDGMLTGFQMEYG